MADATKSEPTRRKVLSTVRGGAAAGGLSFAGLLALAVPWANAQSEKLEGVRIDVVSVKEAVADVRHDLGRAATRTSALEAARAGDAALITTNEKRLDRIELKLDRVLERLK